MIHFTVGPLHRPTTVAGAMKHFGVSSTLRRRIKHSGSCTINGQPASTRDFVREGDVVSIVIPVKTNLHPRISPSASSTKTTTSWSSISRQAS